MQVVKHRFAFCALTAFAALAASATDYYVATTGSDEADGLTAETAFAATDLAGNQRVFGRAIDVGCYELQKNPGILLIVR